MWKGLCSYSKLSWHQNWKCSCTELPDMRKAVPEGHWAGRGRPVEVAQAQERLLLHVEGLNPASFTILLGLGESQLILAHPTSWMILKALSMQVGWSILG